MQVIAHRGAFLPEAPIPNIKKFQISENTLAAFERAFQKGWGIETDIRLIDGDYLLTHDVKHGKGIPTLDQLIKLVKKYYKNNKTPFIAFQLKFSGEDDIVVGRAIAQAIKENKLTDSILFDPTFKVANQLRKEFPWLNLSVSMGEKNYSPTIYTSKEVLTSGFAQVFNGVWTDEWKESGSIYNKVLFYELRNLYAGRIDVISPELHYKENHPSARSLGGLKKLWTEIISWEIIDGICTDYPSQLEKLIK